MNNCEIRVSKDKDDYILFVDNKQVFKGSLEDAMSFVREKYQK